MRTALFWVITQQRMAVRIDVLGQPIGPFKGQVPSVGVKYLEDEAYRLFRNVDTELPLYSA
jgi:hypothetical protein